MNRFVLGGFVAACAAMLLALVGSASAAPVPKGGADQTPDLKAVFDVVGKAVKDEKWPAEDDEKKLKDTARAIFDRMLKAADQKARALPIEFEKLKKVAVVKNFNADEIDQQFVIAREADISLAKNSVIFASGDIELKGARNCIIVAKNIRRASVINCLVIAGEELRINASQHDGDERSVLIAGQWIRGSTVTGAVCHVIRPQKLLPLEDPATRGESVPIRLGSVDDAIVLNASEDWKSTSSKNCTTVVPKTPIAK